MERFPRMFSRGDVGMIRAAEMGGFLPEALEALSVQHEQDGNTRRRLAIWEWLFHINALFLPPLIAGLSFFGALVQSEGRLGPALGAVARTFLLVSLPMTAAYLGLVYLFHRARRSPTFAYRWHRFLLRLPVAAKINFLRANAVFTRVLQQLYQAGVSPANAWDTASGAVPNLYLAERFMQGKAVVESTGRLSVGMQHIGLLQPEDAGMVATGETTGEVPQALDYLANHYEEETRVALGASVVRGALTIVLWGTLVTGLGVVAMALTARQFYDALFKWATPE
jgi:type II secretory pathway component PulF